MHVTTEDHSPKPRGRRTQATRRAGHRGPHLLGIRQINKLGNPTIHDATRSKHATAVMNLAKGKPTQASKRMIRMEEATRADSLTVFLRVPNPMPTPRMVAADDTAPGNYSTSC